MKRFRKLFLVLSAAAVLWAAADTVKAQVVDRVVAIVNNEAITGYELDQAYKTDALGIMAGRAKDRDRNKITKREYLDRMISQKLVDQEVKRQGINISELEIKKAMDAQQERMGLKDKEFEDALAKEGLTIAQYKDKLRQQMITIRLLGQEVRQEISITDQESETFYNSNKDAFQTLAQVHLRHIFLPFPESGNEKEKGQVKAEMDSIHRQLQAGADFATMARKYSRGPAALQGGDIGWFQEGELLEAFANQVKKMKPGQISPVFEESPGFHILYLEEEKEGEFMPFNQVKEQIKDLLYQKKVMDHYDLWMERLRAQSHIEIKYDEQ